MYRLDMRSRGVGKFGALLFNTNREMDMPNNRVKICLIRAIAICLLMAFALPLQLHAEPYFAFREGYKCSTCHVNKTGGGKRNEYGSSFTQTEFSPILEAASENALYFSADIGESFSLGMDFMIVHETLLSVEESIDEGGRNEVYEQGAKNSFDVRSCNLYLEVQLLPEILTLYLDETVSPAGASNREAFVLYDNLPHGGYVKAGRMLLPYGIRLWDDDAFIRQVTGFNYDNQDLGFEVGAEPGMFSLSLALSNEPREPATTTPLNRSLLLALSLLKTSSSAALSH